MDLDRLLRLRLAFGFKCFRLRYSHFPRRLEHGQLLQSLKLSSILVHIDVMNKLKFFILINVFVLRTCSYRALFVQSISYFELVRARTYSSFRLIRTSDLLILPPHYVLLLH